MSVPKVVETYEKVMIHVGQAQKTGLVMWTDDNRERYNCDQLRYSSDVTDDEGAIVKPMIPPAKCGGRKREVDIREGFNGVMYVLGTGCQWRYLQ